jgi:hypothetical protein
MFRDKPQKALFSYRSIEKKLFICQWGKGWKNTVNAFDLGAT